jgi:predicted TIM-barrel fold metal-dependent hydrolase
VHRLDHQQGRFMNGHGVPSQLVKKFWYDSVNGNAAALRCSCDTFGVDRIVFGTDYPFWSGAAHQHASEYLDGAGLSTADVLAISEGNARALFGDALSS